MDKLLDIQLQLSRIAADVTDPSQLKSVSLSPVAVMTPVLIVIEQLLDEIRVSTRAIVAKASESQHLEPRPTKRLRTDDFRVELQSEVVVDDKSETETEDEATGDQVEETEEMKQEENKEESEAQCKPREPTLDPIAGAELEKQIKKCVKSYTNITRKAAELNDKADANQVGRAMSTIARWSSVSMTKLLKLIEGGGVPSVELATDFCDATAMLPAITERHHLQRNMNHKWCSAAIKRMEQITAIAKDNTHLPSCLSEKLDTAREQLKDQWTTNEPDLLHKMEAYISRVKSQPGALESDRIGKTVGKLASLFRHDCRLSSRGRKPSTIPPRTEECWTRFTQIGEVLAEWILLCEQATSKSKLPAQLPCFERKLRGFAKSNPGRLPASLLQASAVLTKFVQVNNRHKHGVVSVLKFKNILAMSASYNHVFEFELIQGVRPLFTNHSQVVHKNSVRRCAGNKGPCSSKYSCVFVSTSGFGKSCSRDDMVRPEGIDASLHTEYVNLSFWSFTFWWVVILAVHLLTSAYNASFAKFYWDFDATFLSYILEPYSIGMPRENFRTIAYVHILLASVHGLCVLHQLVCSFWTRTISFTVKPQDFSRSSKGVAKVIRQPSSYQLELKQDRTASLATRSFTLAYTKIADRRGLFGVNGRYFHGILICREFLETTLQTIQAVRMSKYLPRPELNHFYVGLLVVNCWSAVIIYSSWFWRDEARRRFALVVCDCVLDMMTTVGVSAMVVMPYVSQYNVKLDGFNIDSLSDENWMAQMLNEAQMVLVVSWSDLAMRIVFSLGLILTTANMKDLLRRSPIQKRQIGHTLEPHFNVRMTSAGIRHINWSSQLLKKRFTVKNTKGYVKTKPRWTHTVHFVFLLWGAVVIALHVHANTKTPLVGCIPRVHPMAGALPTCFAVDFNCHTIGISGRKDEVLLEWGKFERKKVVKLRILHCQTFEMPTTLQDFHLLQEFRVYNSTIGDWSEEAAITNTHHPSLTTLSVVRTNMDAGVLPLGLQSLDFPSSLLEIYFCETNLQEIPDDIDSKWHIGSSVYLENGHLRSIPPALVRLQLYYLVLAGNPISEVPPELFENTGMLYLRLGRTNISSLPRTIPFPTPSPPYVDVSNTAISFFWSWIDPFVESVLVFGSPMILASGSTYCSDLEKIMDGVSDAFSAPFEADLSPLLMDPSEQNWDFLRLAVDCSPPLFPTAFPLGDWDKIYSLE